jgi:hypothetical protein
MKAWPTRLWFILGVGVPALLAGARVVVPSAPLYTVPAAAHGLLALTCVGKAGSLLIASVASLRNARAFDEGNPARRAWMILSLAFLAFFLGQACFAPYQIVMGVDAPFPSIADLFWVVGYPLVVVALASFDHAYVEASLVPGSAGRRRIILAVAVVVCLVVGWPILAPVARAPAPLLKKAINLAYPSLDLAVLVVSASLVGTTFPLRRGSVGRPWMWMLGGFVAACFGDVAFSYVGQLDTTVLGVLVDVMLLVSYGAMARAALSQRSLEGEEAS